MSLNAEKQAETQTLIWLHQPAKITHPFPTVAYQCKKQPSESECKVNGKVC